MGGIFVGPDAVLFPTVFARVKAVLRRLLYG